MKSFCLKRDNLIGQLLIFFSSTLLCIWALTDTIALRNILLIFGAGLSFIYLYLSFKGGNIRISLRYSIPLILLGLIFLWVIFHYLFLARYPEIQYKELTSTWLRSFMAAILAFGTGLALGKRIVQVVCLWSGILCSFILLLYQYIPKAIANDSLFAIDYEGYIYRLKVSAVLMGTIMVSGFFGAMLDFKRDDQNSARHIATLLFLIGFGFTIYSYTFIFDTRNGVGLNIIIIVFGLLVVLYKAASIYFQKEGTKVAIGPIFSLIGAITILGAVGVSHTKHNPGWGTMIEDTKLSLQVHAIPNWQDPQKMGYPKHADGQMVKANTYDRVAWATASITIFLPENPLGVGVTTKPFPRLLKEKYPDNEADIPGSHSAWVDIALAFGYPIIFLFFSSVIASVYFSFQSDNVFKYSVTFLSLALFCTYLVGEVGSQHGIEILCFMVSMIGTLIFSEKTVTQQPQEVLQDIK